MLDFLREKYLVLLMDDSLVHLMVRAKELLLDNLRVYWLVVMALPMEWRSEPKASTLVDKMVFRLVHY